MKKAEACSHQEIYKLVASGEKIRVAFLFQVASFWPSWESLYYWLINDSRFEVRMFLGNDEVDKARQLQTAHAFLLSRHIAYRCFNDDAFIDYAPHIVVLQTPYDYTQREHHLYARFLREKGIRVVYIPYGIELTDTKAARHDHFRSPVVKSAWRIYTMSNAFKQEYEKFCANSCAVRGLGLPRFDMLLKKEEFLLPPDVTKKINGRKIVVWHTHFAKRIDVSDEKKQVTPYLEEYFHFAQIIGNYREKLFFIFLPHPRFGDDAIDVESNKKSRQLLTMLSSIDNCYIDTADDYRQSLLNADAIISDRSSLAVEAAAVGVPVLYLKNPDFDEKLFPPLASLFDSYEQGTNCTDIQRFVEDFLAQKLPTPKSVVIPNFDGKCAERISTFS